MTKWLAIAVSVVSVCAVVAFTIYTYSGNDDAPEAGAGVEKTAPAEPPESDAAQEWIEEFLLLDPEEALPKLSDLSTGWHSHEKVPSSFPSRSTDETETDYIRDSFKKTPCLRDDGGIGGLESCRNFQERCDTAEMPEGSGATAEFHLDAWSRDDPYSTVVKQSSYAYLTDADARSVEEHLITNPGCTDKAIHDTFKWWLAPYNWDDDPYLTAFPSLGDSSAGFGRWNWMSEGGKAFWSEKADLSAWAAVFQWVVVRAGRLVTVLSFETMGSSADPLVIEELTDIHSSRIDG